MEEEGTKNGIQVRVQHELHSIHIQGISGMVFNRPYGLSVTVKVPKEITIWLSGQIPTLMSAASAGLAYIPCFMYKYIDDDKTTYQMKILSTVEGGDPLNHEDGVILNVSMQSPSVKELIDFCEQCEYVRSKDDEPYVGMVGEEE